MPVDAPIVTIVVGLLVHVPPAGELVSVVDAPWHIDSVPPIAAGRLLTVAVETVIQPDEPSEYVINAVPAATPHITPVEGSIVATAVLLDDHVPPAAELVSVEQSPVHTPRLPPIVPGAALIVSIAVAAQPVDPIVYDIVAVPGVEPAPMNPGLSTVAIVDGTTDHTPPLVVLERIVVLLTHIPRLPVMGAGPAFTVTTRPTPQPELSM